MPVTLAWSSGDNLHFIESKRKWEGKSGDRSLDKSFKRLSCGKSRVMGQWLKDRVKVEDIFILFFLRWYIFAADEIDSVEGEKGIADVGERGRTIARADSLRRDEIST